MQVSYTPTSYKVSLPVETDPVKAKKNAEIRANLTQALDTLKNAHVDYKAQKKAMAAQRVAQIKEKLKALRQTPGLDAKATARMAANLAKELTSAVKEYAAASASAKLSSGNDASTNMQDASINNDAETLNALEPGAGNAKQFMGASSLYSAAQNTVPVAKSKTDNDAEFLKDVRFIHRGLKSLVTLQKERLKVEKPVFGYFANNAVNNAFNNLDSVEKTLAMMT